MGLVCICHCSYATDFSNTVRYQAYYHRAIAAIQWDFGTPFPQMYPAPHDPCQPDHVQHDMPLGQVYGKAFGYPCTHGNKPSPLHIYSSPDRICHRISPGRKSLEQVICPADIATSGIRFHFPPHLPCTFSTLLSSNFI